MSRIHISSLLIAAAALWGCTAPEENDNPFTRFRGEVFETLQLEVNGGGDLLVMTTSSMVYEYEGKDSTQVGFTRTRNSHSVLYRRSKGSWNATPFRNISDGLFYLPSLVRDAEGGYHAFIQDAGKILRYRYEGTEWVRAEADRLGSTQDVILGGGESHLRTIVPKDDSGVVFCRRAGGEGVEVHGVAGARGSFILDTNDLVKIDEIRMMPGFIGVLGNKDFQMVEEKWGTAYGPRPVYWHWHSKDTTATTVFLPGPTPNQIRFVPHHDRLGIFTVLPDGFYLQPLSSEGTPGERVLLAERNFWQIALDTVIDDTSMSGAAQEGDTRPQSFSQVEVDANGCVHVLDLRPTLKINRVGKRYLTDGCYYANSCSRRREEEIPLPMDDMGETWTEIHKVDLHIDAEGMVRVAVLQKDNSLYGDYAPSRLLIAELGEDGWTTEIAATK